MSPGLSWCEVGEQIGGQQGGQARVTPPKSELCGRVCGRESDHQFFQSSQAGRSEQD